MRFVIYPLPEVLILLAWLVLAMPRWRGVASEVPEAIERQLGYNAVKDAVQAGLTVASIILAGMGVMLGLPGKSAVVTVLSPTVELQLMIVGIFSVLAVLLGAYVFAILPSRINSRNPAFDRWIAVFGFVQLLLIASAAARFAWVVFMVLQSSART